MSFNNKKFLRPLNKNNLKIKQNKLKQGSTLDQIEPLMTMKDHLLNYPTPINLNYAWSFGSLAGIFLLIQIISGLFLSMHYIPQIDLAFLSVEHIMRDVKGGWLFRYIHSNGASFFFIMVYAHIAKAIYYQSYSFPHLKVWRIGIIIFLLTMAIAFFGYVLPWGQMSFWGATVITNLFTAIPFVGQDIVVWLWGGFSVNNSTLQRFFSLHFILPFILVGFILLHLILLHIPGSSNPLKIIGTSEKIKFYPHFYLKDLFSFYVVILIFSIFVFFFPNFLGHPDNYIPANPLITPNHIVPEWYFLPFHAILRSIPDKLLGVFFMFLALFYLFLIPLHRYVFVKYLLKNKVYCINKNPKIRPVFRFFFWCFFFNFLTLGYIGSQSVETPFIEIGQLGTIFYFLYFFCLNLSVLYDQLFFKRIVDHFFINDNKQ